MKTVGLILKEARLGKKLTLADVEKATKIRFRFLEAIEHDDYSQLPSLTYAKGFVKNYGDFLGLDGQTVLAFFRRQTKDVTKSSLLPKGMSGLLVKTWWRLTPGRFLALLVAACISIFFLYLGFQYKKLSLPPAVTIESPKEQLITKEKRINVFGKTNPDATVAINGTSILVRNDGQFFDQVSLETGVNEITITVTSRYGKSTNIIRNVLYQP